MNIILKSILLPALVSLTSSPFHSTRSDVGEFDEIKWEPMHWDDNNLAVEINNKAINLEMEEIADELQRQIDELRKQLKEIQDEAQNSENEEAVINLKKEMEDLQVKVQELYTQLDKLNSELQQEFQQKLDDLAKEMANIHKQLEDRIKDLEDLVQQLTISQCIGNLRDGNVETALGTFRHIKNPTLHIEQIVKDAYRNVKDCMNLVKFLAGIESEVGWTIRDKNEIRSRGYSTMYDDLSQVQFSPEGSDCAYPLAWSVNLIRNRLKSEEIVAKEHVNRVLPRLPKSISKFTVDKEVKLFVPPQNPDKEIATCYENERGEQLLIGDSYWNTTETKDGIWFMLFNRDERPLILYSVGNILPPPVWLSKNKYKSMADDPRALWKPTAVSNSQFYLENKESNNPSGRYLVQDYFPAPYCQCNKFTLSEFEERFMWTVQ